MLETNPGKRYNVHQLALLYDIKKSLRAGKAVACSTDTHALSIHDVKLYNGRWFVLIKDPHNINSFEYTKGINGEIIRDGHLLSGVENLFLLLSGLVALSSLAAFVNRCSVNYNKSTKHVSLFKMAYTD